MPRTIRFHLDEHIAPAVAAGLRRRGIDVTTTADVGLLAATDEDQFAYACRTGRTLVTLDRGFPALAANRPDHPGVAHQFAGRASIGNLIRTLELVREVLDAHEMIGHVEYR